MNDVLEIRNKITNLLKQYYNFAMEIPFRKHHIYNFHIAQNIEELIEVCFYFKDKKFRYFVELGSSNGGSLWLYSNMLCTPDAQIVSIECTDNKTLLFTLRKLRETGRKVMLHQTYSHMVKNTFQLF